MTRRQNSGENPKSRSERFLTRGLPVILGGAALTAAALLTLQAGTNATVQTEKTHEAVDVFDKDKAFEDALKDAAIKVANLEDLADPALIVIPNNDYSLYEIAPQVAAEVGLLNGPNADELEEQIEISSVGISESNLIQPGSGFVLTNVDVNNDGIDELIVQRAPEGYGEGLE